MATFSTSSETVRKLQVVSHVPADIDIASSVEPLHISAVADELGLQPHHYELFGRCKAKVLVSVAEELQHSLDGFYMVVGGITPTPLGEGSRKRLERFSCSVDQDGDGEIEQHEATKLVEDLGLLAIRASGKTTGVQVLDNYRPSKESIASCHPEETFLYWLLETGATENNGANEFTNHVEKALDLRHASTVNMMKCLVEAIDDQRAKNEELFLSLRERLSTDDFSKQLLKVDDGLRQEVEELWETMDALHLKHKHFANEVQTFQDSHAKDQSTIKRLTGDLEDTIAELEESKRKLVSLKTQRDATPGASIPVLHLGNKNDLGDKSGLEESKHKLVSLKTQGCNTWSIYTSVTSRK